MTANEINDGDVSERNLRRKQLEEKEEELRKLEADLVKKEEWLRNEALHRKKSRLKRHSYEEMIIEKEKELQHKHEELKRRQAQLEDADLRCKDIEPSLNQKTSARTVQDEIEDLKKQLELYATGTSQTEKAKRNVTEAVIDEKQKADCGKGLEIKEGQYVQPRITFTDQNSFPKLSTFSGEDSKAKNETTFEEWKYEVDCLRQDKSYTDSQIGLAIRKSLRYQAKRQIMPLGATATVDEMMNKLQAVFETVATRGSIMKEFYTAAQKQDESVTAWGLRLEEILQRAAEKGHIKIEEKNDLLKDTFWRGLRSERLKNATRVHFESISKFELLRKAVREEENQMTINTGIKQQQQRIETDSEQSKEEDPKYKQLLNRIQNLEKQLKYNKPRWPDQSKGRGQQKFQDQQRYDQRPPYPRFPKSQEDKSKTGESGAKEEKKETEKKESLNA